MPERTPPPRASPGAPRSGGTPAVCPHCWMVNPGPFRLCSRCGASMETHLQESGGLRRTAAVQSPVPVDAGGRLSAFQRVMVGFFVAVMALGYLVQLLPIPEREEEEQPRPPVPIRAGP